jgi:uncharacterized protein YjbJ (UPF0337 family)
MQSGTIDNVKGRMKEAAGALVNDKKLKQEGQADQLIGKAKDTAKNIVRKAEDLVRGR